MTVAFVDAGSLSQIRPRHPRPTAVEMDRRAEQVLALLSSDEAKITTLDIQTYLNLTEPQMETLVGKMLRRDQIHVVGKVGKRRLFSRGPASTVARIHPVRNAQFLQRLNIGERVQVKELRLVDGGVEVQIDTSHGPVTLTAAC